VVKLLHPSFFRSMRKTEVVNIPCARLITLDA
jgi:hypothetical protein